MKIKLNKKYQLYSHKVGTSCLLPKSPWKVRAFPTRLEFTNLMAKEDVDAFAITYAIQGLLSHFTLVQDLERQWIRLFGRGPQQEYFSLRLVAMEHKIVLFLERAPKEGMDFFFRGQKIPLKRKERLTIPNHSPLFPVCSLEKMHFGCHKAQDWTLITKRLSLQEILPFWFALGKNMPTYPNIKIGTARLLTKCKSMIKQKQREKIGSHLIDLFRVGFEEMFLPRLRDTDYQSMLFLENETIPHNISPLILLGEGAHLIRQLFIQQQHQTISILPCLPVELHEGRFVKIELNNLVLDFEWSKKLIRRLILYPKIDQTRSIQFQPCIKSFRMRKGIKERGKTHLTGKHITLFAQSIYILDRFQK